MKQKIKFGVSLIVTGVFCFFMNRPLGPLTMPAGKFADPFHGYWQNCERQEIDFSKVEKPDGLQAEAKVYYDERRVPHIFAANAHDLFFLQGYVTARDRLFQMDLQTRFAGGRISEWFGRDDALKNDRFMRRLGLSFAAKAALAELMKDPESKAILEAYAEGVNAWINNLNYAAYPIEYKIINQQPEEWTPLKTCLLFKMMAYDLTGKSDDASFTQMLHNLGRESFDLLYPLYAEIPDPIIPANTEWKFDSVKINSPVDFQPQLMKALLRYPQPDKDNGSNNWAVSGSKSASGFPMLANDPHLGIRLPSLWYEVQLNMPGMNVYGVSLPGSPLVVIGFNDKIAWGLTNAQRDVLDWYQINFKDESRNEYKFAGGWEKTRKEIEIFKVQGRDDFSDTIIFTQQGPVVFDRSISQEGNALNLACHWAAHDASNELKTFIGLAKAANYDDYRNAISNFKCPGQNFVFACSNGDIAITQQGRFPVKWKDQGRFVLDGSDPMHLWQDYIPNDRNPFVKNPERGFASSANQHPTDSLYPYDIAGSYEHYRNRRINQVLASLDKATVEDMKKLQNDNFNLCAAENLDSLLLLLDIAGFNATEKAAYDDVKKWNLLNDADLTAPSVFDAWSDEIRNGIFLDETASDVEFNAPFPKEFVIYSILRHHPNAVVIDDKHTPEKEDAKAMVNLAFHRAVEGLQKWKKDHGDQSWTWSDYRHTEISHLLKLKSLGRYDIHSGGNDNTVNSMKAEHGPSWRMIVEVGPEPKGWGIIPGGVSGNPGSFYYDNGVDPWSKGEYFPLLLLKPTDDKSNDVKFVQTFKP